MVWLAVCRVGGSIIIGRCWIGCVCVCVCQRGCQKGCVCWMQQQRCLKAQQVGVKLNTAVCKAHTNCLADPLLYPRYSFTALTRSKHTCHVCAYVIVPMLSWLQYNSPQE